MRALAFVSSSAVPTRENPLRNDKLPRSGIPMSPEDRERMFELCRIIDRENDPKMLAVWISELHEVLRRKLDELKKVDRQKMDRQHGWDDRSH